MDELKRARRPVRREFDKLHKELQELLKAESIDEDKVNTKFKLFCDACDLLHNHDEKIVLQMTTDNVQVNDENKEWDEISDYKFRAESLRQLKDKQLPNKSTICMDSVAGGSNNAELKLRNFKLPTIEMRKFRSQLEDWLGFWAQFQKIDEDPMMCGSDKFWYLLQSLEPDTDAHELATGYAMSNENYPVVIEALKKQYANENLQLQVYIRKLLKLVISNVDLKGKMPVKNLYLKLDSHLRALKSLNLSKADPATWLFPLVESCLPESILNNWQRSALCAHDGSSDDPPKTRVDLLMEFVGREIAIQQRIEITRSFVEGQEGVQRAVKIAKPSDRRHRESRNDRRSGVSTLSSFHVGDGKCCVFCEMKNHDSGDCYRAKNMRFDDKMEILKKKGLCFRCTGKHLANECRKKNVECEVCKRSHLTVLCKDLKRKNDNNRGPPPKRGRNENKTGANSEVETTNSSNANLECSSDVALKTLLVKVKNGVREKVVRAFIDDGCQRSYLLKSTARNLCLNPIGSEKVIHSLFGGNEPKAVTHNKYEVTLGSVEGNFETNVEIRDHIQICGKIPRSTEKFPAVGEELRKKGLILSDLRGTREIELLIGADLYPKFMTGKCEHLKCGAVAIKTKLGWTLMGTVATSNEEGTLANANLTMAALDVGISKLWDLESIGIRDPCEEISKRKRDELAKQSFVEKISGTEDGKYSVRLPWKENLPYLPSNKEVALKRLKSCSKKLCDIGLFGSYDEIFKAWEKEGFIERVATKDGNVHYLPHRPVIKNSLTTPVRPVFDASCRVGKSPSLNDCLHTGENLVQLIPDLLLRFRHELVAFVADIRKAFQMIGVNEEDRDFMRFLWWNDKTMNETVEYRHARVMFGATCSPFILAAVIDYHLNNLPEGLKEWGAKLLKTLYVDNCVNSVNSREDYHDFKEIAIKLLNEAGMDLRMWLTNFDGFEEETNIISVLGLLWNRKCDDLSINVAGIQVPVTVTKRSVLSAVPKVYDPVRFTSPATLTIKLLLQRTWASGKKWDEELPENEKKAFLKWVYEIEDLGKVKIPRLSTAGVTDREKWQLHTFNGASKSSYATVVFLRVETDNGVQVQLLTAKSRVAPMKNLTIPKMELMSCLIGVRQAGTVKRALSLDGVKQIFWTDSMTALAWIRNDDQWGTFVANRTREINLSSSPNDWRHVPGIYNPADLPSRGCSPSQLLLSKWWEGPTWLYKEESQWPVSYERENIEEINPEKRKAAVSLEVSSLCVAQELKKSYTFAQYVRIIAWVRRFLNNKFSKQPQARKAGRLSEDEIRKAEIVFIRNIQNEAFPQEKREDLRGLEIIEDDNGALRVKTRLVYRDDAFDFKYPMLLPCNREETKQLIRDYH